MVIHPLMSAVPMTISLKNLTEFAEIDLEYRNVWHMQWPRSLFRLQFGPTTTNRFFPSLSSTNLLHIAYSNGHLYRIISVPQSGQVLPVSIFFLLIAQKYIRADTIPVGTAIPITNDLNSKVAI